MNIYIAPIECFIWLPTIANAYLTATGISQCYTTFIMLTFHAKLRYKMLAILNPFVYNNLTMAVNVGAVVHWIVYALMGMQV